MDLQQPRLLPPRILIYGEPKKGKTTFAYNAPNTVFIQTEDGLDAYPDAKAFPLAESFEDIMNYLGQLATEEHEFNTLAIDSMDWLETLIHTKICKEKHVDSIADIGYGAGYTAALAYWREFMSATNWLRENKNMMIIFIAHSQIADYKSPDAEAFSKHMIKLHKAASAYVKERSDIILFVNTMLATKTEKKFGTERKIALGGDERVLYTHDKNSSECGTRFAMPKEIPFDKNGNYWNVIYQHVPFFNQTNQIKED
jgi:hypothetical protein